MNEVQAQLWEPLMRAFFLGCELPIIKPSSPGLGISTIKRLKENLILTESSHNTALIYINRILRLDPPIFVLPNVEVPVNSLGSK
jgi:hypothetical protein